MSISKSIISVYLPLTVLHNKIRQRGEGMSRYQHFDEVKDHFKFHDLEIDEAMYWFYVEKQAITLTNREYQLLVYLLKHLNFIFSCEQLLDQICGDDFYGDERVVDTYIKSIRKKIGVYTKYIKTVSSVGYAFKEELWQRRLEFNYFYFYVFLSLLFYLILTAN